VVIVAKSRAVRLLGIPLSIDPTWLFIFVWATWSLSTDYAPQRLPEASVLTHWLVGAATSLLFFVCVLLHELGHALVARAQGQPVRRITLHVFGGAAEIDAEPPTPGQNIKLALAGPAVSLALGGAFLGVARLSTGVPWLTTITIYLGGINVALAAFNLLPGLPLDGGRVLRALLWRGTHDLAKATRWTAAVGRLLAYAMMGWGMLMALRGQVGGGLWLLLVGTFLDGSARAATARDSLDRLLAGHTVAEAMTYECLTVPPQLTLDLVVEHYLLRQGGRCLVVSGGEGPVGLLTAHQVQHVPRNRWLTTHAGDVCRPLAELRTVSPETPLRQALEQMSADGVNQLLVFAAGELQGMITREGLLTFIRQHDQQAAERP